MFGTGFSISRGRRTGTPKSFKIGGIELTLTEEVYSAGGDLALGRLSNPMKFNCQIDSLQPDGSTTSDLVKALFKAYVDFAAPKQWTDFELFGVSMNISRYKTHSLRIGHHPGLLTGGGWQDLGAYVEGELKVELFFETCAAPYITAELKFTADHHCSI